MFSINIWILDSDSGVTLLYKPYMDLPINEDLVSGLLTALNQFTVMEFKQGIESIDMGGLRWVYVIDKESSLMFIAAANKDQKAEMLRARLNVIKQSFLKKYVINTNHWAETWDGNIERFLPFKDIIDEYYSNWLAAENISTMAEFFDILGVFQQVFFDLLAILQHISEDLRERICKRIEIMFDIYKKSKIVSQNRELKKISFSRESGISIITINPSNCDMLIVERQLINLMKNVITIIKEEIGHLKSIEYFAEENVFSYILNNISLLNQLNLDKFFLELLLRE